MGKIGAVVVFFNPDLEKVCSLVDSLVLQVELVTIVDNGSGNLERVKAVLKGRVRVFVLELGSNYGIAKAQNVGAAHLIKLGIDRLVFFDQDSVLTPNLISTLAEKYDDLSSNECRRVGAVGPIFKDPRYDFYYPVIKLNKFGFRDRIIPVESMGIIEVSFIISSGSLCSVDTFIDVGGFREEYFIDYVDTEWCLRAKNKGYEIFVIADATMEHTIGDSNYRIMRWRLPVHSPVRRYYRMRNIFYLMRLGYVPFVLKFRELLTSNAHHFILLVISNEKRAYFLSWVKALKDGFKILFRSDADL